MVSCADFYGELVCSGCGCSLVVVDVANMVLASFNMLRICCMILVRFICVDSDGIVVMSSYMSTSGDMGSSLSAKNKTAAS